MISYEFDQTTGVLHIQPKSALEKSDFEQLAKVVDPIIEKRGGLTGLIVEIPSFPGWDSFGAFLAHMRFVRDHHKKIRRIAVVTDSGVGNIATHVAPYLVSAEIKRFPANALADAKKWVSDAGSTAGNEGA